MPAWLPAILRKNESDKDRSPEPAVLQRRGSVRANRPVVHLCHTERRSNLGRSAAHKHHAAIRHSFHRAVLRGEEKNHPDGADRCRPVSCRNRFHHGAVAERWFPRKVDDAVINSMKRLVSICWAELRERYTLAAVFENNLHGHIDVNFVNRTADYIAAEARAFIEIDPRGNVGDVRSKTAQRLTDNFTYNRKRKYFSFAADFNPVEFVAGAIATNGSRAKNPAAAVLAFLNHQFAGFGAVPERLINGRNLRNRLFDRSVLIRHSKLSPFES
jgi:hypothetical protein